MSSLQKTKDKYVLIILSSALLLFSFPLLSQERNVSRDVLEVTSSVNATFGIAWKHLESGDSGSIHNAMKFPMQSVYKFPLALAILDRVDKKQLRLDQKVRITQADYPDNTWSPIMKKYPDANVDLTLEEILMYTVSHSDNVGCDILFKVLGSPEDAGKFIHSLGINNMHILTTEKEMHEDWEAQFRNWCDPSAMITLLEKFYQGQVLSKKSTALLMKMMEETSTGPKRIRGLLPPGTVVAHRTGSSGRDADGKAAAVNDVGIITLPDKTHLLLVAYVSNSPETMKDLELAIARVSKVLYDFYSK